MKQEQYNRALQLVEYLVPLFPQWRAAQLTAQTHRAWAQALVEESTRLPYSKALAVRAEGESQYRLAGRAFARLAQLRFATRYYPDDVWDSANAWFSGHGYEDAVRMFDRYLENEVYRQRATALTRMGEALLVLGHLEQAIEAVDQAIEVDPNNAATYVARLLASQALLELGDTKAAAARLLENLRSEYLSPSSAEWRDSLFALGRLLHFDGEYQQSVDRLSEAVARYPEDPRAVEARYLLADSQHRRARQTLSANDSAQIESARLALVRQAHGWLGMAIRNYEQVAAALSKRREETELSPQEELLLRNCRFFLGAALVDQGRYQEAIDAFSTATNHYQRYPEVLRAYVQIADCYRRLNRPLEARGTIEQAKVVLARIPEDARFTESTNWTRQQWVRLLEQFTVVYSNEQAATPAEAG